jgi:hypothetical protein
MNGDAEKLYVAGIPGKWGEKEVLNTFKKYGAVKNIYFMKPPKGGQFVNNVKSAFVTFERPEYAEKAKELDGHVFDTSKLQVRSAVRKTSTPTSATMRPNMFGGAPFGQNFDEEKKIVDERMRNNYNNPHNIPQSPHSARMAPSPHNFVPYPPRDDRRRNDIPSSPISPNMTHRTSGFSVAPPREDKSPRGTPTTTYPVQQMRTSPKNQPQPISQERYAVPTMVAPTEKKDMKTHLGKSATLEAKRYNLAPIVTNLRSGESAKNVSMNAPTDMQSPRTTPRKHVSFADNLNQMYEFEIEGGTLKPTPSVSSAINEGYKRKNEFDDSERAQKRFKFQIPTRVVDIEPMHVPTMPDIDQSTDKRFQMPQQVVDIVPTSHPESLGFTLTTLEKPFFPKMTQSFKVQLEIKPPKKHHRRIIEDEDMTFQPILIKSQSSCKIDKVSTNTCSPLPKKELHDDQNVEEKYVCNVCGEQKFGIPHSARSGAVSIWDACMHPKFPCKSNKTTICDLCNERYMNIPCSNCGTTGCKNLLTQIDLDEARRFFKSNLQVGKLCNYCNAAFKARLINDTSKSRNCTLFVELYNDDKKKLYNDYCEMVIISKDSLSKMDTLLKELIVAVAQSSDGLFDPQKHNVTKLLYLTRNDFQKEIYARIKQDSVLDEGKLCNNMIIRVCFKSVL